MKMIYSFYAARYQMTHGPLLVGEHSSEILPQIEMRSSKNTSDGLIRKCLKYSIIPLRMHLN